MSGSTASKPKPSLKIPLRIRISRLLDRHKTWSLVGLLMTLIGILIYILLNNKHARDILDNPGVSAVFGAFVGAIGAGGFSLYILRRQFESAASIARKNTIYIPLYNDLLKKYASLKGRRDKFSFEMYDNFFHEDFIWTKMKYDNRHLEVPTHIAGYLSSLVDYHDQYKNLIEGAEKAIVEYIHQRCIEKFNAVPSIQNLGSSLLFTGKNDVFIRRPLLDNLIHKDDYDAFVQSIKGLESGGPVNYFTARSVKLTESEVADLEGSIYKSLYEIPEMKLMISQFDYFMDYFEKVILYLKSIIMMITHKYEIRDKTF